MFIKQDVHDLQNIIQDVHELQNIIQDVHDSWDIIHGYINKYNLWNTQYTITWILLNFVSDQLEL